MNRQTLVLQSTAETQILQSIGLMQAMTLSSFVSMHRKKDRLYNKNLAKRMNKEDQKVTFQNDSVINTLKTEK